MLSMTETKPIPLRDGGYDKCRIRTECVKSNELDLVTYCKLILIGKNLTVKMINQSKCICNLVLDGD